MANILIYPRGCLVEQGRARYLIKLLKANGHTITSNLEQADCIIMGTCAAIDCIMKQEKRELEIIGKFKNPNAKIFMVGCLSRLKKFNEEGIKDIPGLITISQADWVPEILKHLGIIDNNSEINRELEISTRCFYDSKTAIDVNIGNGCTGKCTFCKYCYLKNTFTSIPFQPLLEYLTAMVKNGTKIINLVSENTTQYGLSLYHKPMLHLLIKELSKLDGLEEIVLSQITARDMYPELLEEIQTNPKIKRVDLQLQTASDRLLGLMRRGHDIATYTKLINDIRKYRNVYITTVLMSCFPTETMEDINQTINYIRDNDIYVKTVCHYQDSPKLPAHKLPQLSKEDYYIHDVRLRENVVALNREYLLRHANDIKEAIVIGHTDKVAVFDTFTPINGYSYKLQYQNMPSGTIINPHQVKLVNKTKVLNGPIYKI